MVITRTHEVPLAEGATPGLHRFTVEEYYRMAEVGLLDEDSRVELIDGVIIDMPPIGPGHASSVERFCDRLRSTLGAGVQVRCQNPVRLGPRSEPEPDVVVVPRRDDFYASGHPMPSDILLLVEIADSSLDYDRDTKVPLYAGAGIIEYWIVNLVEDLILVHRDPNAAGYSVVQVLRRGDTIRPLAFPDIAIAVSDLLQSRA